MLSYNYSYVNIFIVFIFWRPRPYLYRDEMRFAYLALISSRQMSIHASMMSIFLVAMTKKAKGHPFTEFLLQLCTSLKYFLPSFLTSSAKKHIISKQ